jgi:hypothetical protein
MINARGSCQRRTCRTCRTCTARAGAGHAGLVLGGVAVRLLDDRHQASDGGQPSRRPPNLHYGPGKGDIRGGWAAPGLVPRPLGVRCAACFVELILQLSPFGGRRPSGAVPDQLVGDRPLWTVIRPGLSVPGAPAGRRRPRRVRGAPERPAGEQVVPGAPAGRRRLRRGPSSGSPLRRGPSSGSPLRRGPSSGSPLRRGSSSGSPLRRGSSSGSPLRRGSSSGSPLRRCSLVGFFLPAPWTLLGWTADSWTGAAPTSGRFWQSVVFSLLAPTPVRDRLRAARRGLRAVYLNAVGMRYALSFRPQELLREQLIAARLYRRRGPIVKRRIG